MENEIYKKFLNWIGPVLENTNFSNVLAFNFNLYEGINEYHIQLVGCDKFDADDSDWICSEVFTIEENIFKIDSKYAGEEWWQALDYCVKIVTKYLENGSYKNKLLEKLLSGLVLLMVIHTCCIITE